tara:strand:- start:360 stop:581 length:222 start_codon:yes stop_codon:yes gene_type:complete
MAKKAKTKKKDLLKKEPKKVPNLSYEERVAIKTSGVPESAKKAKTETPAATTAKIQHIRARPKTWINDRKRNR